MTVEETNLRQEQAMTTLRERIEERKRLAEEQNASIPALELPKREIIQPLPEITHNIGQFKEFNYERFMEVQNRLDVAYCNWLVVKEDEDSSHLQFDKLLKELIQTVDLYVAESIRPRY